MIGYCCSLLQVITSLSELRVHYETFDMNDRKNKNIGESLAICLFVLIFFLTFSSLTTTKK